MDPITEAILAGSPASITPVPAPALAPVADKTISPPPVDPGQPPPAPVVDPAVVKPDSSKIDATPAPAKSEPLEQIVSDEQLLAVAGIAETPEKKLGRLERERSAEGKENRRLSEYVKRLKEDILDAQGLVVTEDEQKLPNGLLATKKYSKDVAGLDIKVGDLPAEIQALFDTEPQKAIDFIADKARKSMTKVAPTLAQAAALPLSPERHETAIQYLTDMKWETGDVKFPGLAANRKVIEQMISVPSGSKALKEFYNQDPETALALLNLQLDHARSHITERGKKAAEAIAAKKAENDKNPQPQPAGGGAPTIGGAPAGDLASQVAHAPLGLY